MTTIRVYLFILTFLYKSKIHVKKIITSAILNIIKFLPAFAILLFGIMRYFETINNQQWHFLIDDDDLCTNEIFITKTTPKPGRKLTTMDIDLFTYISAKLCILADYNLYKWIVFMNYILLNDKDNKIDKVDIYYIQRKKDINEETITSRFVSIDMKTQQCSNQNIIFKNDK